MVGQCWNVRAAKAAPQPDDDDTLTRKTKSREVAAVRLLRRLPLPARCLPSGPRRRPGGVCVTLASSMAGWPWLWPIQPSTAPYLSSCTRCPTGITCDATGSLPPVCTLPFISTYGMHLTFTSAAGRARFNINSFRHARDGRFPCMALVLSAYGQVEILLLISLSSRPLGKSGPPTWPCPCRAKDSQP